MHAFIAALFLTTFPVPTSFAIERQLECVIRALGLEFEFGEAEVRAYDMNTPLAVQAWNPAIEGPAINPHVLLPEDFIRELTSRVGPVRIVTERISPLWKMTRAIRIVLEAGNHDVIDVTLYYSPSAPNRLVTEELTLSNPLIEVGGVRSMDLRADSGLPMAVFNYARGGLIETVRAAGVQHMVTLGAQSYAVFQLYRRVGRMQPGNELSAQYYALFDEYFRFATENPNFPAALRPRRYSDMNRFWGTFADPIVSADETRELAHILSGHFPHFGVTPIRDRSGRINYNMSAL